MIFFKNENGKVFAYSSESQMLKFNNAPLTPITYDEVKHLTSHPEKTIDELRTEIDVTRRNTYADPISGSDALFNEAYRMQLMSEEGWELVRDKAVARFQEIQAQYPWPEEPTA